MALLASACLGPTQVTLDIQKDPATKCEDLHEVSIVVAVEPLDAESRVEKDFVTATTQECDPATNKIGTLVVTPSDAHRAAIVVVVASGAKKASTQCKPNDYGDCIVARRRFSFSDHEQLRMPITLDIDCRGKPCDAYSTCRKGLCFDAETSASGGGTSTEPGATDDGGTNMDAAVTPDAVQPADDGGKDSGIDASQALAYCTTDNVLHCASGADGTDVACTTSCCETAAGSICGETCTASSRRCCTSADCGGDSCLRTSLAPGYCGSTTNDGGSDAGASTVYCDQSGNLVCGAAVCDGPTNSCCVSATTFCALAAHCDPGQTKKCCSSRDCPSIDGGAGGGCIIVAGQFPAGATPAGNCQ